LDEFFQGITELLGFKLRGRVSWEFSVPLVAKVCDEPPKVSAVQERTLSPCQVWWGSDLTFLLAAKTSSFLSVYLSITSEIVQTISP